MLCPIAQLSQWEISQLCKQSALSRKGLRMAQPKLLITDTEWTEIQKIALERGVRGQALIRDAVLGWLRGSQIHALPVVKQTDEKVLSSILAIRSDARALAERLDRLVESLGGQDSNARAANADAGAALERATADLDTTTEKIDPSANAGARGAAKTAGSNRKRPANRR
jgi:hypothetical protein